MGLDANGTKFLLYARTQGVDFATTATIGRQGLNLTPPRLRRNLGAREVHAFDASPYEGATHIHDLNRPRVTPRQPGSPLPPRPRPPGRGGPPFPGVAAAERLPDELG